MSETSAISKIAFLGDYLPRKCGIATFTSDLRSAIAQESPKAECLVVPVNNIETGYEYPVEVRFEIEEQELSSYLRAADFLNISSIDLLCVQHEFGIYGGKSGSHVLALLHDLRMPIVTTLHTILEKPSVDQLRTMKELVEVSTRLVVMTEQGRKFLRQIYGAPARKIDVIPHGIPDIPFADPNFFKDEFGVAGKNVLLTFGLLSPNKGIEYALRALPGILEKFPETVYIVVGQTHPSLLLREGEQYRLSLELLAKELGVQSHVAFFNRFVDLEELTRFIGACDIYITPYLTEAQITSGTLAYAFGTGNAVISTPYWHAKDLLSGGEGTLVPFRDAGAISDAVQFLLNNDSLRHAMRKHAYEAGRSMVWGKVAEKYLKSFQQAGRDNNFIDRVSSPIKTLGEQPDQLPRMNLAHLDRMTDSAGIFQHASFNVPNFSEGYCTDDNARALVLVLLLQESGLNSPRIERLGATYAAFLNYAFDRSTLRFKNFMSFDRRWLEETGSEDSHGQALWALGLCMSRPGSGSLGLLAAELFELALPAALEFTSPRAWAFTLIGIDQYLQRLSGDRRASQIRAALAERLMQRYRDARATDWEWFEDTVTYANAKLPHALLVSGRGMGNSAMVEVGLSTLSWICRVQTSAGDTFRPIGTNGFYSRNQTREVFDQQPIEAQATISACIAAYGLSENLSWVLEARKAFEWFLGRNDLGIPLYDSTTGGCRDGLHADRVSGNQGCESTLAFLLSLAEMQSLQGSLTSFKTKRTG